MRRIANDYDRLALHHAHPDGFGLGKNHLRYRRQMARGGPPLTKPFDTNPIRGHALPARGRHRFGGRAGSTITVPGTNPSPDPKEEPLKRAGKRPMRRLAEDDLHSSIVSLSMYRSSLMKRVFGF